MLDFLGDIGISPLGLVALPALLISYLNFVSCLFLIIFFFNVLDFHGYIGFSPLRPGCPVGPFDLLFEFVSCILCIFLLIFFSMC